MNDDGTARTPRSAGPSRGRSGARTPGEPGTDAPSAADGWRGWDEYAEFYDWENGRTMGTRDVRFWQHVTARAGGPVLELGCGTGRVTSPLARTGVPVYGVDRSVPMLARASRRLRRLGRRGSARLVRADITALPFADRTFAAVLAPYGVLQSLLSDRVLNAALASAARVSRPGAVFGLELVPDVPRWKETERKTSFVSLAGPNGQPLRLVESVRQDRARRLTTFEHEFVEGVGRQRRTLRFTIAFRTLRVASMARRLERFGFAIDGIHGGYRGEPWSEDADTWVVLARRE